MLSTYCCVRKIEFRIYCFEDSAILHKDDWHNESSVDTRYNKSDRPSPSKDDGDGEDKDVCIVIKNKEPKGSEKIFATR